VSTLAALRPNDWDLPLFVHVFGAMLLVGALVTCTALVASARGDERLLRAGWWTLLAVALPGWILMRVGGQWIYSKQAWENADTEPTWLGVGWLTADLGGAVLLASIVTGGFGVARLGLGKGAGLLKATLVLSIALLALYVVTVWAMSAKPGQ
jgi:hypothetical protein